MACERIWGVNTLATSCPSWECCRLRSTCTGRSTTTSLFLPFRPSFCQKSNTGKRHPHSVLTICRVVTPYLETMETVTLAPRETTFCMFCCLLTLLESWASWLFKPVHFPVVLCLSLLLTALVASGACGSCLSFLQLMEVPPLRTVCLRKVATNIDYFCWNGGIKEEDVKKFTHLLGPLDCLSKLDTQLFRCEYLKISSHGFCIFVSVSQSCVCVDNTYSYQYWQLYSLEYNLSICISIISVLFFLQVILMLQSCLA